MRLCLFYYRQYLLYSYWIPVYVFLNLAIRLMPRSGKILAHFVPANVSTRTSKYAPKKVTELSSVRPVLSAYSHKSYFPRRASGGLYSYVPLEGAIGYCEGEEGNSHIFHKVNSCQLSGKPICFRFTSFGLFFKRDKSSSLMGEVRAITLDK